MHTNRPDVMVAAQLEQVFDQLKLIRRELFKLRLEMFRDKEKIMSALSDLQDAMSALINEATTDLEAVIAKIGTTPPDDTAALQALTQQANDAIAKLKADMAPLTAAPAPTPEPTTESGTESPPSI